MPSWRPVLAVTVITGAAILLLFPDYLTLQTAPVPDEFRGTVGGEQARVYAAATIDLVFSVSYGLLGVIAYQYVAGGWLWWVGSALSVGAAVADLGENVMVLLNVRAGAALDQDGIDLMARAGSIKWGLASAAIVLLLALAGQQWLERRRGY